MFVESRPWWTRSSDEYLDGTVSNGSGQLRPTTHLRTVLWSTRSAFLSVEEGIRRMLRKGLSRSVRNRPSSGERQVKKRGQVLCAFVGHRCHLVGCMHILSFDTPTLIPFVFLCRFFAVSV